MNTWQQGSAVDLRVNDRTGSPLVKKQNLFKGTGTDGRWDRNFEVKRIVRFMLKLTRLLMQLICETFSRLMFRTFRRLC